MPIVEIARFPASDSFKADNSLINPALDHLSKVEGCIDVYYGFKEEDKEIVYLVIVWETYECHQALMDNQASCSSLINKIGPNIGGGATQLKIKHIELNDDPSGAFNSATTEFFSAKAKEGKSQDKFKAAITAMGDLIVSAGPPTAIGEVREEPGELFFIIGWESVKAHYDVVSDEKFVQPHQNLQAVGDLHMLHVKLIKYA